MMMMTNTTRLIPTILFRNFYVPSTQDQRYIIIVYSQLYHTLSTSNIRHFDSTVKGCV